eukprot:CAMPEP_0183383270 /NCGR_PEP_ID=MMETSP0164_2-20130417/127366_1 /TAXON_ID=221442 /ORGANISM="Coccolithus pelagicus ssp braarudi, Strain PLY182g" /LENGTH=151 /DNA_ID=CAMNT_0025560901 /DNA_START=639 /DNA_END=1095 /DNA_ORIENTATION=+
MAYPLVLLPCTLPQVAVAAFAQAVSNLPREAALADTLAAFTSPIFGAVRRAQTLLAEGWGPALRADAGPLLTMPMPRAVATRGLRAIDALPSGCTRAYATCWIATSVRRAPTQTTSHSTPHRVLKHNLAGHKAQGKRLSYDLRHGLQWHGL